MTALQNKRSDLRLVTIADGARDNGNFLATAFPEAIQIRDFFHAAENLKKVLDNIYPTDSERAEQRWNELRGTLLEETNGIDKVLAALRDDRRRRNGYSPQKLKYFTRNQERMRYAEFRKKI
ncbi:MAG: hypothetical protein OXC17_09135 [Aestuariivita sp.]|nr:hypothetical protein [Aestuariivita sp.]